MSNCTGCETLMDVSFKLKPASKKYKTKTVFRQQYQSVVSSLMYAILGTQPDIAFAISKVSQFASNPNNEHWTTVKRIFRYLKATNNYCFKFRESLKSLFGYSDADWAGDMET